MDKLNRMTTTLTPDIVIKETTGSDFSREQRFTISEANITFEVELE